MPQTADSKSGAGNSLPIATLVLPDGEALNTRLTNLILGWSETLPGQVSNLPGGKSYFDNKWLSNTRLHKTQDVDVQTVTRFIEQAANRMLKQPQPRGALSINSMWCMVSRDGLVGNRHDHASLISAAYYVDAGSSGVADGGMLQFFSSRESTQPTHQLTPATGVLFLFPGSLEHSISPYSGARPRIVISANLGMASPA